MEKEKSGGNLGQKGPGCNFGLNKGIGIICNFEVKITFSKPSVLVTSSSVFSQEIADICIPGEHMSDQDSLK